MLRRLLCATRLDLVAAFVSNGPGRSVICPFPQMRGVATLLRCSRVSAGLGFWVSAPVGAAMFLEFSFYISTDVVRVKWELWGWAGWVEWRGGPRGLLLQGVASFAVVDGRPSVGDRVGWL